MVEEELEQLEEESFDGAEEDDSSTEEDLAVYTERFIKNFHKKYRKNESAIPGAGCWIWTYKRDPDGYGQVRVGKKIKRAHRVAYELHTGKVIPIGEDGHTMDIDHLCHMRQCVNPDHLEAVTHKENMKRLRKPADWAVNQEEFKKKTTAEEVIEQALAIIDRSQTSALVTKGYALDKVPEAPWRELEISQGVIAQDKFAVASLFLVAVAQGANWKEAAEKILGVSPYTLQGWNKNPYWKEDFALAKKAGRRARYDALEEKHVDELERKIQYADFKDIAASLKSIREQDEDRIAAKNRKDGGVSPITIVLQGANEATLRSILEAGEAIEAEYERDDN